MAKSKDYNSDNDPRKGKKSDDNRKYMREYMQKKRASNRDIDVPGIVNPERRESCRFDLRLFLLTYFAERFPKPFSDDHIELIKQLEYATLTGNMKAFAMPRGSGKTTISECAAIWSAVYGQQPFIVHVAATSEMADDALLKTIKVSFEHTDLLFEDFPHACAPIRALEGENKRCIGQTYNGEPTLIQWKKERIVLPKIDVSECSETVIHSTGILGTVRGLKIYLKIFTGVEPIIHENTWPYEGVVEGIYSTVGEDTVLMHYVEKEHCFVVELPMAVKETDVDTIRKIHRIIDNEKPAHTQYYVIFAPEEEVEEDFAIEVGLRSTIGVDTWIGTE